MPYKRIMLIQQIILYKVFQIFTKLILEIVPPHGKLNGCLKIAQLVAYIVPFPFKIISVYSFFRNQGLQCICQLYLPSNPGLGMGKMIKYSGSNNISPQYCQCGGSFVNI